MARLSLRQTGRLRRHRRVRKRVIGTPQRPRLSIHRSHRNLIAQIIDDRSGRTLVFSSTLAPQIRRSVSKGGNLEASKRLGDFLAASALQKGIGKVVFDRGGYRYHGRVKAVAETARAKGLEF